MKYAVFFLYILSPFLCRGQIANEYQKRTELYAKFNVKEKDVFIHTNENRFKKMLLNTFISSSQNLELENIKLAISITEQCSEYFEESNSEWFFFSEVLRAGFNFHYEFNNDSLEFNQTSDAIANALSLDVWNKTEFYNSRMGDLYRIKANVFKEEFNHQIDSALIYYNKSLRFYKVALDTQGLGLIYLNKAILLSQNIDTWKDSPISNFDTSEHYFIAVSDSINLSNLQLEQATYFANKFTVSLNPLDLSKSDSLLHRLLEKSLGNTCEASLLMAQNFQNHIAYLDVTKKSLANYLDSIYFYLDNTTRILFEQDNLKCYRELLNCISVICPYLPPESCTNLLDLSNTLSEDLIEKNKLLNNRLAQQNIFQVRLTEKNNRRNQYIKFAILLILIGGFAAYYLQRIRIKNLKENLELKLEALRSQMNPHFISNSINAIESLVNQNKNEEASEYLIDFSRLCRMILDHSKNSLITIEDEIECLKYYLSMESLRLYNQFDYSLHIDSRIDQSLVKVPPLLIQPFVENSIWHGIMNKPNPKNGIISVEISKTSDNMLRYIITDNGIGRDAAKRIVASSEMKKESWGQELTFSRIRNLKDGISSNVSVEDVVNYEGKISGTRVIINLPIFN